MNSGYPNLKVPSQLFPSQLTKRPQNSLTAIRKREYKQNGRHS